MDDTYHGRIGVFIINKCIKCSFTKRKFKVIVLNIILLPKGKILLGVGIKHEYYKWNMPRILLHQRLNSYTFL